MCSTAGLIGFQVAQGVGNYFAGREQAKVQREFQAAKSRSVIAATLEQEAGIEIQRQQDQKGITREKQSTARDARRVRAEVAAQQVESGAAGTSAESVIQDLLAQGERKQTRLESLSESVNVGAARNQVSLEFNRLSQLNQINTPIRNPSLAGAVLGIGANVASTLVMTQATQANAAGIKGKPTGAKTGRIGGRAGGRASPAKLKIQNR